MRIRRPIASLVATLLALAVVPLTASPATAADPARTPDHAVYTYDLRSSERGRTWTGSGSVTFENTGAEALDVVYLRLWANTEGRCDDPAVTVSGVTGGTAGTPEVRCTALAVTLDAPLAPGATTTVGFDLEIRVPEIDDRFGYQRHTARMGNALPILAVHDDEGWHLDPPYRFGESFYSLVSDWTVTLDVLAGTETPATGTMASVVPSGGRESRTYVAEDVRDFAWEAGPFEVARARDALGTAVRLSYPAWLLERAEATALARRSARMMDTFSEAFGAYPYPEIDIVLTTFSNFGGMEYPQLVMSIPDLVVISHELAHQWWYGIVGNDQYEDPWIDEGFAQWSQWLPFRRNPYGGRWPDLPWVGCAMLRWPNDEVRLSTGVDYYLDRPSDYWVPYWQGGCALARLANEFGGLAPFLGFLRDYAASQWLGVSTNQELMDAISVAAAELGLDLDPAVFFERWRITRP